jgi:hypothetical protein
MYVCMYVHMRACMRGRVCVCVSADCFYENISDPPRHLKVTEQAGKLSRITVDSEHT